MTTTTIREHTLPAQLERPTPRSLARVAGIAGLVSVGLSIVGAMLLEISDSDLFAGMETSSRAELSDQLDRIAGGTTQLVVALSIWLVAFPMTALAGVLLSRLSPPNIWSRVSRLASTAAVGTIPVFLVLMMTFVVVIAPAHASGEDVLTLARAVGFAASTIDWLVTALVLGIGPVAAVLAGRSSWVPAWLRTFAIVTLAVTVVELVALATDHRDLSFVLVPVGLAHVTAASIVALRHHR